MVTSPYEWKILEEDDKPQTNKQTTNQTNNQPTKQTYKYISDENEIQYQTSVRGYEITC